ncbi:MAG: LysR family transcriptional regulator [Gammaproteobacteria bacterium]|nr:LysR family transcriptional regulator [Gammaproteobacteria bacterium]MDH5653569.1 LysR family transcriptional regulator [Gammaproteobacteria bacterium]
MRSEWLDSFLVFSDCLNFTHAAELLHISQPALHVKIKKLEDHVGLPLYRKQGRQLYLTPHGEQIRAFARETRERSDLFLAGLRDNKQLEPLKLAAGEGSFLYLLGPAIKHFRKTAKFPLSLVNTRGTSIIDALRSGQAHLGVSALQTVPAGIKQTRLTVVDQVVVMPKAHPLAKKKTIKPVDLHNEPLIIPPRPQPHRETIEQAFNTAGVSLNVALEAGGWEMMLQFVNLGMGISIVNSCCHIPSTLAARKITELPPLVYHILELRDAWYKEANREMIAALKKYADHWKQ